MAVPARARARAGRENEYRSNLIVENAHGEPITAARGANEEHGAVAHNRWRGTQDIVNFEVAVRRQLDARKGRAVLDKGGGSCTNQRGKYTLSRRPSSIVAATQN